jgi:F-type H+-transporting ATPase subunit gamma
VEALDALSRRIATTEDLDSIVRTMKSLSAVSIKQYEDAVASLRTYTRAVELGFSVALRGLAPPIAGRERGAVAVVVFGSDHGLCGRFNEQIGDFARAHVQPAGAAQRPVRWLVAGARAAARLEAAGEQPGEALLLPGAPSGLVSLAQTILTTLDRWRSEGNVDRVLVAHNRRTEHGTAVAEVRQLLPLDPQWLQELLAQPWPSRRLPAYSMEIDDLLAALVREHLFLGIYRAGAESLASEHATRLAAMQAAERNIEETLEELGGAFRRQRQEAITEELLDVVAGFNVLQAARKGHDAAPDGAGRKERGDE